MTSPATSTGPHDDHVGASFRGVRAVLVALAAVLFAGAGPASAGEPGPEPTPVADEERSETRVAEDVAAFVNAERRAHGLSPLRRSDDPAPVEHANERGLLQREPAAVPSSDLAAAYGDGTTAVAQLDARLGTGTRSGEAVAGWLADRRHRAVLLRPGATEIAVAVTCQPGERGGDLVLTVHVIQGERRATGDTPVASDRPGAGRGQACRFAELATGPTPQEGTLLPAALTLATTLTLALAATALLRRRALARIRAEERRGLGEVGGDRHP